MPSGYTAYIYDSKDPDFREFTLLCSRAFGANVHQRDESLSSEIVLRTPSSYDFDNALERLDEIKKLAAMSDAEVLEKIKEDHQQKIDSCTKRIEDTRILEAKYNQMLQKVEAWQPPTADHQGLKDFMTKQIKESMAFDCGVDWHEKRLKEYLLKNKGDATPDEWRAANIAEAFESFARSSRHYSEELERCRQANSWILQLAESLQLSPDEATC